MADENCWVDFLVNGKRHNTLSAEIETAFDKSIFSYPAESARYSGNRQRQRVLPKLLGQNKLYKELKVYSKTLPHSQNDVQQYTTDCRAVRKIGADTTDFSAEYSGRNPERRCDRSAVEGFAENRTAIREAVPDKFSDSENSIS